MTGVLAQEATGTVETCDPWQGLSPAPSPGTGCLQIVDVQYVGRYEEPGLFFAVIVVLCLAALVVAQLVKR